ncbi:TfoX/Sxy family protein [Massilia sp. UMI-21]|nr:TfoX/Sxy family protein [Massilia sp. UMI-21]
MGTERSFVDYVTEVAGLGSRLTHKKMFGEYALYLDGKVVAFACDNSLYIKPSQAVRTLAPELPQGPPYPGAKDYPIADQLLDEPDALRRLLEDTAALMPLPKPKKSTGR